MSERMYVGRRESCGHIVCASWDDDPKETARFVADAVKRGLLVSNLTAAESAALTKDSWCLSSCPESVKAAAALKAKAR